MKIYECDKESIKVFLRLVQMHPPAKGLPRPCAHVQGQGDQVSMGACNDAIKAIKDAVAEMHDKGKRKGKEGGKNSKDGGSWFQRGPRG